jgi:hypothetical protein
MNYVSSEPLACNTTLVMSTWILASDMIPVDTHPFWALYKVMFLDLDLGMDFDSATVL